TTTFNGNIALAGSTVIAVQGATDTLVIGGSGQGQGQITGNQTLTKYGPGTVELGGFPPKLNAPAVVVNEGTLRFNKPTRVDALAGGGSVTVGDNIGGQDADKLVLAGVEQIPDGVNVTVNSTGLIQTTAGTSVGDVQGVQIPNNNSA